jgi:hypothetical protein
VVELALDFKVAAVLDILAIVYFVYGHFKVL